MTEEEFLQKVAELFDLDHQWIPKPFKRTRWFPREAGNGRFEGHGVIRWFAPDVIHVALTDPRVYGTFKTAESALEAIKLALTPILGDSNGTGRDLLP